MIGGGGRGLERENGDLAVVKHQGAVSVYDRWRNDVGQGEGGNQNCPAGGWAFRRTWISDASKGVDHLWARMMAVKADLRVSSRNWRIPTFAVWETG